MRLIRTTIVRFAHVIVGFVSVAWMAASPVFAADCGSGGTLCLQNPLRFPTISQFVEGVLQAIVVIGLPIITVFVVYAGFKYIAARGNPQKIQESHTNFMWVMVGAALILGAWVLATLIGGTVTQLLGPGAGASQGGFR